MQRQCTESAGSRYMLRESFHLKLSEFFFFIFNLLVGLTGISLLKSHLLLWACQNVYDYCVRLVSNRIYAFVFYVFVFAYLPAACSTFYKWFFVLLAEFSRAYSSVVVFSSVFSTLYLCLFDVRVVSRWICMLANEPAYKMHNKVSGNQNQNKIMNKNSRCTRITPSFKPV